MKPQTLRRSLAILLLIIVLAPALLTGCRKNVHGSGRRSGPSSQPMANISTCPIDGQPTSNELLTRRPLAVMVENSPKARPQSGLNNACVVYEAITEGGITRFLAIFAHSSPAVIGPVRSARPHFINLEREYDAVYAHCGQSLEALQMLVTTPQVYNLDQLKFAKPFWRDHSRRAPHNLYTSAEKLRAFAQQQGWSGTPAQMPSFTSRRSLRSGSSATTINIGFGGAVKYKLRFVYDAKRGGYLRYMDGKLHIDRETKEPVLAKNILIQRVYTTLYANDPHNTYDVSVTGNGEGFFVSNQRQIPIRWQKDWAGEITKYTDVNGHDLPYQSGQTWVEIVPMEGTVSISGPAL